MTDCPVPVVDLRGLVRADQAPSNQPNLCKGLLDVIEGRAKTGVDIFPWVYDAVNPFLAPPGHFASRKPPAPL